MTSTLVLTIVFGLLIGYWVVSKLLSPSAPEAHSQDSGEYEQPDPPRQSDPTSPESPWFDVLQVPRSATVEEISAAYKSLIRQYHPDKVASLGPELKELAESKSKAINAAYKEALRQHGP